MTIIFRINKVLPAFQLKNKTARKEPQYILTKHKMYLRIPMISFNKNISRCLVHKWWSYNHRSPFCCFQQHDVTVKHNKSFYTRTKEMTYSASLIWLLHFTFFDNPRENQTWRRTVNRPDGLPCHHVRWNGCWQHVPSTPLSKRCNYLTNKNNVIKLFVFQN